MSGREVVEITETRAMTPHHVEWGYDCFLVSAGSYNPGVDSGLSSIAPVKALIVLCDHRKVVYFVLFSLKLWLCSPQVLTLDYHPFPL